MSNRLGKLWKLMAGFDMIDIDNDYFMVKFDLEGDRVNVMEGVPWMNFDHYPTVQT